MSIQTLRSKSLLLGAALSAATALSVLASADSAAAQSRDSRFGLGGMVGEPSGLSLKLRLSDALALDMGVGFGAFGPGRLNVHADFIGALNLTDHSRAGMDLYFGAGPRLALGGSSNGRWKDDSDGVWLGVRGAVGLVWEFKSRPLDVFVEAAPTLWIIDDVRFDGGGAVGARYWF